MRRRCNTSPGLRAAPMALAVVACHYCFCAAADAASRLPAARQEGRGAVQNPGVSATPLSFPAPPRQDTPWTPPAGKEASGFPPELVSATQTLFAQGLPDPRGCEYRAISVQVGSVFRGDGETVETHGWLLPADRAGKRFAICWNGLVYPVVGVKGRADLRADIRHLPRKMTDFARKRPNHMFPVPFTGDAVPEEFSVAVEDPSLLKAVYLLRLGETDPARAAYALWSEVVLPRHNERREIARDPYRYLASRWAWAAYDRAICAHVRGADALAAADTALLARAQPIIEVETARRSRGQHSDGGSQTLRDSRIYFLDELPALRRDSLRRLVQSPLTPLDVASLKALPRGERIAELVRRLDQVDTRQEGPVSVGDHPVVGALIAEGDAAVEALLDVLEKDDRLTRSVTYPRYFRQQRHLRTVKEVAFICFSYITRLTMAGSGDRSAAALRRWWEANRNVSHPDRWFAQLAEDGATAAGGAPSHVNRPRWEEAATLIVERERGPTIGSDRPLPPFKGEPLRSRRNPSVSDLLKDRALRISDPTPGRWGFDYVSGAKFALMLYEWEAEGEQTLPTLREVMRRCLDFDSRQRNDEGHDDRYLLGDWIARLTVARLRLGDGAAAVDEYGAWLKTVSPRYLGAGTRDALQALWMEPDDPAMVRLADVLFAQDPDASPTSWSNLMGDPAARGNRDAIRLFASDLLRLAAFRDLVIRRLGDAAETGSVSRSRPDAVNINFAWKDGTVSSYGWARPRSNGSHLRQILRIRDRCALELQKVSGTPRFDPLAPVAERDRQCDAIADFLRRYGATLGRIGAPAARPLHGFDPGGAFIYDYLGPVLPAMTRPATEADVRKGRAIFHLSGPETRAVTGLPAPLPLRARWLRDPDPDFGLRSDGKRVSLSEGFVWQAEEVYDGKKWVRYYGYVGPHAIGRVPASEIEIADYRVSAPTPAVRSGGSPAP